ncbi:hypothetical protein ACR780_10675 [Sphingobacterium faecium]|uniref:hypothetical protein n=1 Tax=Sphingobacterium faecium TaxID=34087 RepID=UPI003DA42AB6
MIKVYVDWNVMSQLKNGLFPELYVILQNQDKFYLTYSTAHIGDIANSNQGQENFQNIKSDLNFITELTNNRCVFNTGQEIIIENRSPHEIYQERVQVPDFNITNTLNAILDELDDEHKEILKPMIKIIQDQSIDPVFKNSFENPETTEAMRKFLPDLENNYTFQGLLNSISTMFTKLNTSEDFKNLRNIVQSGLSINRDKIFATGDPYNIITQAYSKMGVNMPEIKFMDNVAPEWYNKINWEYINLDMHGYQEDNINVSKGRKETFKNTSEDAAHAAFASMFDFYITNDKKNYNKTQKVFEKLEIDTLVMKPMEFIEYYNNFLSAEDLPTSLNNIKAVLKHISPQVSNDGLQKTFFTPYFIFDYFNKIHIVTNKDNSEAPRFFLSRVKPTNNKLIYFEEVEIMIKKLNLYFNESLPLLELEEQKLIIDNLWRGRDWNAEKMVFMLRIYNGFLQIYIE